jgi:hypothetical protein
MAFADIIRTNTWTSNDIANLIEGIVVAGYPLAFTAWTPTYGAGGSMTFTSVTTTRARYFRIGKFVVCLISFSGTTGGSASNGINLTGPASANGAQSMSVRLDGETVPTGVMSIANGTSNMTLFRSDFGSFGLGTGRGSECVFIYEAA